MEEPPSSTEKHSGNWYVLLAGLPRPDTALELAQGVVLCPLDAPFTVFDLAAVGASGFREWAVLEPMAAACHCEIETAQDSAVAPGYDALNRAWLASALLVLRGFTRHLCVACSAYSWNVVAGHQQRSAHVFERQLREEGIEAAVYQSKGALPQFQGGLLDFHLKMTMQEGLRQDAVSPEDASWIKDHFEVFNALAAQSEVFRLALEASMDWRFTKNGRSAVARLWSGIEAILGISSELVYRISLLSACLLAERGRARKTKFEEVKKLYGLRSKIVHGEPTSDEKIAAAINGSFRLLADLLMATVNKGHVLQQNDFDEAVFE